MCIFKAPSMSTVMRSPRVWPSVLKSCASWPCPKSKISSLLIDCRCVNYEEDTFKELQEDSSRKNYAMYASQMLMFAMSYPTNNPTLTSKLSHLKEIVSLLFINEWKLIFEDLKLTATALHEVLLAILQQSFPFTSLARNSDVVFQFIALSHLELDGTFKEADRVSSSIAKLFYLFRCLFIHECHIRQMDQNKCEEFASKALHGNGSFNGLQELMVQAYHFKSKKGSSTRVVWTDHLQYRSLLVNHKIVSLDRMSTGIESCYQSCKELLHSTLLMKMAVPHQMPKLNTTIDHLDRKRPGSSFLWGDQFDGYLLSHVLKNPMLADQFVESIDEASKIISFNRRSLAEYHQAADRFMDNLLFLIQTTFGQPKYLHGGTPPGYP